MIALSMFLVLLIALAVGGGLTAWALRGARQERREEMWSEFARQYPELEYREGPAGPELHGTYLGTPIHVYLARQGNPNSPTTVTRFVAKCQRSLPSSFDLIHQSSVRRIRTSGQGEAAEILTGNRDFDRAFVVAGDDANAVRELLQSPELRQALLTHSVEHADLRVLSDGSVSMRKGGRVSDPPSLKAALDAMVDVTAAFEGRSA